MMFLILRHGQTETNQPKDDWYHQSEVMADEAEAIARYNYRVTMDMRKQKTSSAVSMYEIAEYNRDTGEFVLGPLLKHDSIPLKTIVRYNTERKEA